VSSSRDSGRYWAALALAVLFIGAGCGDDESPASATGSGERPTESVVPTEPAEQPLPTIEEVPDPVAQTRAAILAAAKAGDYDALEQLIDPEVFLSDSGFGVDPVPGWRAQGTMPLETMEVLLGLPYTVEEGGNEGTLYRWPRFTADSSPDEMSRPERDALVALLGDDGLRTSFTEDYGYTAPRLGILADGTWWFLVMNPGP
jgi:hypothetical protein